MSGGYLDDNKPDRMKRKWKFEGMFTKWTIFAIGWNYEKGGCGYSTDELTVYIGPFAIGWIR